jgi:hypothetical protein
VIFLAVVGILQPIKGLSLDWLMGVRFLYVQTRSGANIALLFSGYQRLFLQ